MARPQRPRPSTPAAARRPHPPLTVLPKPTAPSLSNPAPARWLLRHARANGFLTLREFWPAALIGYTFWGGWIVLALSYLGLTPW